MYHQQTGANVSDYVTYCAGLPFVGSRGLAQDELNQLEARRLRMLLAALLWLVFPPLVLPLTAAIVLRLAMGGGDSFAGVLALLAIIALFAGLPVGLLRARDLIRRCRVLRRGAISGSVRCFAGICTDDDLTDLTLQHLIRTGLAEVGKLNRLELLFDSDVIYRLNDSELTRWTTAELTTAASIPVSPARFKMPAGFETEDEEAEITRRRLTSEERVELNGYVARLRKSRWMNAVPALLTWWSVSALTFKLSNPEVRRFSGIVLAVAVFAFMFQRATRCASRWRGDAEFGWLILIETADSSEASGGAGSNPPMEILPLSNSLWTIRGKPAGWRKHTLVKNNSATSR